MYSSLIGGIVVYAIINASDIGRTVRNAELKVSFVFVQTLNIFFKKLDIRPKHLYLSDLTQKGFNNYDSQANLDRLRVGFWVVTGMRTTPVVASSAS